MEKLIVVSLVIVISAVVQTVVDKACGIDFSNVSAPKQITHVVVYEMCGAAIAMCGWFL